MIVTVSDLLASDYEYIQSEDIKHDIYFGLILEHTLF